MLKVAWQGEILNEDGAPVGDLIAYVEGGIRAACELCLPERGDVIGGAEISEEGVIKGGNVGGIAEPGVI